MVTNEHTPRLDKVCGCYLRFCLVLPQLCPFTGHILFCAKSLYAFRSRGTAHELNVSLGGNRSIFFKANYMISESLAVPEQLPSPQTAKT